LNPGESGNDPSESGNDLTELGHQGRVAAQAIAVKSPCEAAAQRKPADFSANMVPAC